MRAPANLLRDQVTRILEQRGVPPEDGRQVADVLVEAELEGIKSHGLSRLAIYLAQLDAGGLDPRAKMQQQRPRKGILLLETERAIGPVVAGRAVQLASQIARELGLAAVAVRGAGHVGPLSYYVKRLAEGRQIGLAFANSPPAMAPWGGRKALIGTNPIAFAVPTAKDPWVVDLALSVTARGNIIEAARREERIPEHWAVDAAGNPTSDPEAALKGTLLPMGGPKGYALALMVEVLAGILAGRALSADLALPWEKPDCDSLPGFFVLALDSEAFGETEPLMSRLADLIQADGARIPGSRRFKLRRENEAQGIPIEAELQQTLSQLGISLTGSDS